MTNTIIQFDFSDEVFMTAIYIRSDTHQDTFIPFLTDIVKSCEGTKNYRGWSYVVAEIITKITNKYDKKVKFILESQFEPNHVCFKYKITVPNDISSSLIEIVKIKNIIKKNVAGEMIDITVFDGLLKDFNDKIIKQNNSYRIKEIEKEIKDLQLELNNLKNDN
jgi:hypothetical protein